VSPAGYADPDADPAFFLTADPDPATQIIADRNPQPWSPVELTDGKVGGEACGQIIRPRESLALSKSFITLGA
jgi:hypothetical protein